MNTHNQSIRTSLHHESYDLAELLLKNRIVQAIADGASRCPIHRELRFAARMELESLFDAIALSGHWAAQRLDATNLILDADGVFITGRGGRKQDYCSTFFEIWGATRESAEAAKARILAIAGDRRITEPMFAINCTV